MGVAAALSLSMWKRQRTCSQCLSGAAKHLGTHGRRRYHRDGLRCLKSSCPGPPSRIPASRAALGAITFKSSTYTAMMANSSPNLLTSKQRSIKNHIQPSGSRYVTRIDQTASSRTWPGSRGRRDARTLSWPHRSRVITGPSDTGRCNSLSISAGGRRRREWDSSITSYMEDAKCLGKREDPKKRDWNVSQTQCRDKAAYKGEALKSTNP